MKIKWAVPGWLVLLGFVFLVGSVRGQDPFMSAPVRPQPTDTAGRETVRDRLNQVRQLIAQGAYLSAVNLLENYREEEPENGDILDLLYNCYIAMRDFARAEILLQQRLEKDPSDFRFYFLLTDLYMRLGADSLVDKMVSEIQRKFPDNPETENTLIRMLVNFGDSERAMAMIEERRQKEKNPSLFALEAASVYELKGDYYRAALECYAALQADSARIAEVERKIAAMLRMAGAPPQVIRALLGLLEKNPGDIPLLRLLEEAYIKENQLAEAFNVALRMDSLAGSGGRELFVYLRQCRERKLYDQVVKMGEYIYRKYASDWTLSEYRFYFAEALAALGRYAEALAHYRIIVDRYPQPRDQAEALLNIGNLYRYQLKNYDSARVYYQTVSRGFSFAPFDVRARIEVGLLYMTEGKLDSAENIFRGINVPRITLEEKEFIDYNLALIQFFGHKFGDASVSFRRLIEQYPRGFQVNDALINSLVISEGTGLEPDVLSLYSDALYFEVRLMSDSVQARLEGVVAAGETPLLGPAFYRLAQFYLTRTDTAGALGIIERMEKGFAGNYFFPYCLKLRADILAAAHETKPQAAEIYKTILEKFGDYPFVGEVREKLQELEGYRLPG